MKYKAAVIGGGMIGARMDTISHPSKPQTHAGGYQGNDKFDLVAICDPEPAEDLHNFGCNIYKDTQTLLKKEKPDIVSVAVPENLQFDVLTELLQHGCIKAVIAEKPLADTLEKSRDIVKAYQQADIPLLVNYTRRYSKLYQNMSERFKTAEEHVVSASIHYAKGLWHNGSHAIDLALLLFGNCQSSQKLTHHHDFYDNDPSVSAFLSFKHCPQFTLQALHEEYYTLFEVDIFTDKARYTIHNDHREMKVYTIHDNCGMPPGKRLILKETLPTDYEECMTNLIDHLADVLENNTTPICTRSDALKSLEIAYDLSQSEQ